MEDVRVRFGKALRERRHKLGVSQEEFADICGLDRTYVGGIERGERNVALVKIEKLARAYARHSGGFPTRKDYQAFAT
jgi:transcriptional regulator with XRE-family HTH domain